MSHFVKHVIMYPYYSLPFILSFPLIVCMSLRGQQPHHREGFECVLALLHISANGQELSCKALDVIMPGGRKDWYPFEQLIVEIGAPQE